MRRTILFSLALVALSVFPISSLSRLAAPGLNYYETYVGQDFDPIDGRNQLRYIGGSEGGVAAVEQDNLDTISYFYSEIHLDLPVGAQITEVTFYYKDCTFKPDRINFYLGSYSPTASFAYHTQLQSVQDVPGNCTVIQSISSTGAPLVTVDNSQRSYVVGAGVIPDDLLTAIPRESMACASLIPYRLIFCR